MQNNFLKLRDEHWFLRIKLCKVVWLYFHNRLQWIGFCHIHSLKSYCTGADDWLVIGALCSSPAANYSLLSWINTLRREWNLGGPRVPGLCGLKTSPSLHDVTKGADWQTIRAVQESMLLKGSLTSRPLQYTGCLNFKETVIIIQESFMCTWSLHFA